MDSMSEIVSWFNTGKKVKYQFWNNTGISVVLYWGIIGMFTRIPTLEK